MEIRYIDPKKLKPHPLNESLIPPMTPEEFEALVEDVKEKGVLQPLEVQKGTNFILDGRNRWKAALRANLESIPYREVDVPEEEVPLYILERVPTHRSLPPGVRAALAAEWVEAMRPYVKRGRPEKGGKISTFLPTGDLTNVKVGKLRELAAKKFGVNDRYVQIAWNLKRYAIESFELLKRGEITLQEAQGILTRARIEKEAAEIVAFPGSVLLKRTHHAGEEAKDHSQTHDPGRTQGVQEKTWPLTEGSCGIAGCQAEHRGELGGWHQKNPRLSIQTFDLSGKRRSYLALLSYFFSPEAKELTNTLCLI